MQFKKLSVHWRLLFLSALMISLQPNAFAVPNDFDKPVLHPAIPLVDEDGQHVLTSQKPYSTRMSCGGGTGGCHDIDKISNSYHFDMGRNEADDRFGTKRNVVPVVSPGYFGGYNCMLSNNPLWLSKQANATIGEFLDYGAPGLIKACGGCHNGGGFGEKDRDGNRYDQTAASAIQDLDGDYLEWQGGDTPTLWDWKKSGVVEPDCLLCHADFSQLKNNTPANTDVAVTCQDMDCSMTGVDAWTNLRANLLFKNGFFRYANTSILKYLNITPGNGSNTFLVSSIDNLNSDSEPTLTWNPAAFDSNGKMEMQMLRFPDSANCMMCHNTSHKRRGFYGFGPSAVVEHNQDGTLKDDYHDDVHKGKTWVQNGESRDIENCNACHSKQYYKAAYLNVDIDADHNFLVGNSDQDVRRDLNFEPGPLSCEYCHGGTMFDGAPNAALPSGNPDILTSHKILWTINGDMEYGQGELNGVTKVHLDVVACQTCHIPTVENNGEPIKIRFRYHETEDGRLKMAPYQATPRYYWWDKNNQRIISRRERLQVAGSDTDPQSYDEVKQLKTGFDALLTEKGYKNVDTQMVWTESNDYLITHNTKPAVAAMPCDDCHTRAKGTNGKKGKVSSLIRPDGVLGISNKRVVASMPDNTAYSRLVNEGVVKLDMPYFSVATDGTIVENVSDILYATKLDPFTSALRATSQSIISGEFKLVGSADAIKALDITANDTAAVSAVNGLSDQNLFLFNSRITGKEMKDVTMLAGYNSASKIIVPNYRMEVSSNNWMSLSKRINRKKTRPNKNYSVNQGTLKGVVTSSVFSFDIRDQQRQRVHSLGGHPLLVKLPYAGYATDPSQVGFLAVEIDSEGAIIKRKPLSPVTAQIISVVPGNTVNYGYVTALVNELPENGLLYDLKLKKKKKR